MPMDGLTAGFAARELNQKLAGGRIDKISQPEKDTVIMVIRSEGENRRLLLCASPNNARCHLTVSSFPNPLEPPVMCMILRKQLLGGRVLSVRQIAGDRVIHIDIDTASISRNVIVDVPIVCDAKAALEKLNEWAEPHDTAEWRKRIAAWEKENPLEMRKDLGLCPQSIMEGINEVFPEGIFVTDVGQHQMWASQYINLNSKKKMITSGGLGTMGFGFPAAIGAKIGDRDKDVVCITGDGGMQMNMQELATSICADIPVTICLFNNRYLGMVRQQQQYFYGKRYQLTYLGRRPAGVEHPDRIENADELYVPDYLKLVDSYGIKGIRVKDEEKIVPALEEAKKAQHDGKSMLIEFEIAPEDVVLPMVKGGMANSDMILK